MAHAKPSDLEDVQLLLENLRTVKSLKEKSVGCFYFKSKGVLHFHIKGERRWAHVFTGKTWEEMDFPAKVTLTWQNQTYKKMLVILKGLGL